MNPRMVRVSFAVTLLLSASLVAVLVSTSQAETELHARTAYADCAGKMESVEVHAGPQGSTRLLQTLTCGEQVTVIGRADEHDWFKVKTQQGVGGYVWMFLSDHQSPAAKAEAKKEAQLKLTLAARRQAFRALGLHRLQSQGQVKNILAAHGFAPWQCGTKQDITVASGYSTSCFASRNRGRTDQEHIFLFFGNVIHQHRNEDSGLVRVDSVERVLLYVSAGVNHDQGVEFGKDNEPF